VKTFNFCKKCKECCQTKPGDGFNVFLTDKEKIILKRETLRIDGKCEFLKKEGCSLGENKPLMCKSYPIVPHKFTWRIMKDCPNFRKYLRNLKHLNSLESIHLNSIKNMDFPKKLKKQISEYYECPEGSKQIKI